MILQPIDVCRISGFKEGAFGEFEPETSAVVGGCSLYTQEIITVSLQA